MQAESHDVLWLDQWQSVSISELAVCSGLSEAELHELVDYGALAPTNPQELQWTFTADCVFRIRKASRLRDDLELDTHALALAILLLDRIDALEAQLSEVRAQLPHRFSQRSTRQNKA
jgi:chaperone modulatory protein CbpM